MSALCTEPQLVPPSAKNAHSPSGRPWASTVCMSGTDRREPNTRKPTDPTSTSTSETVWQLLVPGWQTVTEAQSSLIVVHTLEVPTDIGIELALEVGPPSSPPP